MVSKFVVLPFQLNVNQLLLLLDVHEVTLGHHLLAMAEVEALVTAGIAATG